MTKVLHRLMPLAALFLAWGCVSTEQEVKSSAKAELAFPPPPDEPRFVFERVLRSNLDVTGGKVEENLLEEALTGVSGSGNTALSKPFGVAVHEGRVYVGDTVGRSVLLFDPANAKFKKIGTEDPGRLSKPLGMETDRSGKLYVVDGTAKVVQVYDKDGKFLQTIGKKEMFEHPAAVAVSPDGGKVFVVDTGSSRGDPEFHRVRVFDGKSGSHLYDIGRRGSAEGELNLARDADIGPDGNLYVVDGGNFRVEVFTQTGEYLRKFGSVGRRFGQLARPKGIGIDKQGNLYISDASHGNFQIFTKEGQLLLFIGNRGKQNERTSYMLPGMLDVDEDGRVYMVDQGYKKVEVYRPASVKDDQGALGIAFKKMKAIASGSEKPAEETPPPAAEEKKP